ncbi:hypothetical protein P22_2343 [Propionispora sp. 2/2-37]|uniref:iron-containing alcohol dehydrogenase n=1 Tax=Propionispora sp. 2/2-37 TaxID=1677858 RepID=UPI0006BB5BEA|nr:iron-containing alcohol dehydrogenase [Propionispora sp. 2/2-37]CUH96253.1 hypothetical protein P22_2343 [Propionispora sp. 2/2-37]
MKFSYYMPTTVIFGCGEFDNAAGRISKIGQRALIVTGKKAMQALGYTEKLQKGLCSQGVQTALFANVSAEPHTSEVNDCVDQFKDWNPDVIVALGGGSAIDAAKGIALGFSTNESVEDYLVGNKAVSEVDVTIPLVAISTTAGTGAELNWAAILTDSAAGIKTSFRHKGFFPQIAIIDPMLTISLSNAVTMETGFDAFAHAVETAVSKATNPMVKMHSLEAIGLIRDNLPQVIQDGHNLPARTAMHYASMLMGASLANSSTCLPHRLQYPIGIKTGSSHGAGLISLFKPWLEHTYEFSSQTFNELFSVLAGRNCQRKAEVLAAFDRFTDQIGANYTLRTFGLSEKNVPELVSKVSGSLANDPAGLVPGVVQALYNGAIYR